MTEGSPLKKVWFPEAGMSCTIGLKPTQEDDDNQGGKNTTRLAISNMAAVSQI